MEALQGLGVIFARRAPHGECAFGVFYNDDPLGLHVDHGLQRIGQLPCHLAISGQMVSRSWS